MGERAPLIERPSPPELHLRLPRLPSPSSTLPTAVRAGLRNLHTAFNMGKGKGQSQPIFEITNHLSKKENTKLRKAESMVLYWDARVPFWNGKGSPADLAGQKVRESIKAMEEKARARYDALY